MQVEGLAWRFSKELLEVLAEDTVGFGARFRKKSAKGTSSSIADCELNAKGSFNAEEFSGVQ